MDPTTTTTTTTWENDKNQRLNMASEEDRSRYSFCYDIIQFMNVFLIKSSKISSYFIYSNLSPTQYNTERCYRTSFGSQVVLIFSLPSLLTFFISSGSSWNLKTSKFSSTLFSFVDFGMVTIPLWRDHLIAICASVTPFLSANVFIALFPKIFPFASGLQP